MIYLPITRHSARFACRCIGLSLLGAVLSLHSCSVLADESMVYEATIAKIKAALPSDWSVAETKADVLPEGHYWGMEYDGRKGLELVLQGPRDVLFHWKDRNDTWHQEPVAKEALDLWLMPSSYEESWRRFFVMKRPKTAKLLFSGPMVKVYSFPSSRVIAVERVDEIFKLKLAKSTDWRDSPSNTGTLSWETWKDDLQRALQ